MQQQSRTLYNTQMGDQRAAGQSQTQNANYRGSQEASDQISNILTATTHELGNVPLSDVKNDKNDGQLSPLEIIDQTDDDEKLLQALEGLTLDSGLEEPSHSQLTMQSGTGGPMIAGSAQPNPASTSEERKGEDDPRGEHGTRSQFIKDVSDRLISRVNTEAANIEEAKQLMSQYMMEFCAEYDRCGYSVGGKSSKFGCGQQSDNQPTSTNRTSVGASAGQGTRGPSSSSKQSQSQMTFDNQILKKGVRVLSKNLQRANQQNRVKDQQLKVMRNILIHQKSQLASLQTTQAQMLSSSQSSFQKEQVEASSPSTEVIGMIDALHFASNNSSGLPHTQPDSCMMGAAPMAAHLQQHQHIQNSSLLVQGPGTGFTSQDSSAAQRAILNRSRDLQSMQSMNNFNKDNSKPDIY